MQILELISPTRTEHAKLNPLLWTSDRHLIPQVKSTLIKIARHFQQFVEIDFPVIDLQITGGQTTRYYTDHSDLDLHLITDYSQIDCDQELAELFDTKRLLYRQQHEIHIHKIPVELYIEDLKQPAAGGAYSIVDLEWIRPSPEPDQQPNNEKIEQLASVWDQNLRAALDHRDLTILKELHTLLQQYRRRGLAQQGEYAQANLVFKTLRNSGIVDQLRSTIRHLEDQKLSLD
jgi:hypothetical protein